MHNLLFITVKEPSSVTFQCPAQSRYLGEGPFAFQTGLKMYWVDYLKVTNTRTEQTLSLIELIIYFIFLYLYIKSAGTSACPSRSRSVRCTTARGTLTRPTRSPPQRSRQSSHWHCDRPGKYKYRARLKGCPQVA